MREVSTPLMDGLEPVHTYRMALWARAQVLLVGVAFLAGTAYEEVFRKLDTLVKQMEKESATAEEVARFLVRVFEKRRPKARYAHWRVFMDSPWTTWIPDLWWDAIMGRMLGLKPSNSAGG